MACHYAKLREHCRPRAHIRAFVASENPQMWDPFRESTTSNDSEVEVEDKTLMEARPVMVRKLKTQQQQQPKGAYPDLLSLNKRDIYQPP